MGAGSLETLGRNEIAEVAQRAGAGAIVVGGISKAGSEIRIDAQLEDLASGRVLVAESVRGTDLFVLVDQLAARIRDGIGFRDATGIRKVSDVSTASLEAFQLYSQGGGRVVQHANGRRGEIARTRGGHRSDVRGRIPATGGRQQLPRVSRSPARVPSQGGGACRPAGRTATAHSGSRVGSRQRAIPQRAARAVDELIEKFPDADQAYGIAAQLYAPVTGLVHDPEKWLTTSAAGAAALPRSMLTRNVYAYTLLGAGRYEEALGEFEAYVRVAPREPNPFDSLGEAYLVMGAPDRALESYSRALTIDPTFAGSRIGRAWSLASLGRYDEAIRRGAAAVPAGQLVIRQGARSFARRQISRGRSGPSRPAGEKPKSARTPRSRGYTFLVSSLLAIERGAYERALQDCRLGRTHVRESARREEEGRPRAGSPDERDRAGQGRPH